MVEEDEVVEVVIKEKEIKMMTEIAQKVQMLKNKEPEVVKYIKDAEEVTRQIMHLETETCNKFIDLKVKK